MKLFILLLFILINILITSSLLNYLNYLNYYYLLIKIINMKDKKELFITILP